jgi:hypothetical protein
VSMLTKKKTSQGKKENLEEEKKDGVAFDEA